MGLFFKLFGTNVVVARGVLLFSAAVTILLLYWMTCRIYHGPMKILPAFFFLFISFPLWPGTNHHWDSNLFGLLAVGAFFLWQDLERRWFLALAGILAGLTSCFLQQKGLCLVVSFTLIILVSGQLSGATKKQLTTHIGILLGGYAAIGCLVLLFFFLSGGLSDLIYANLIWPLTRYQNVNRVPYGYGVTTLFYENWQQILQIWVSAPISRVIAIFLISPLLIVACLPLIIVVLGGYSLINDLNRANIFNSKMLTYWLAGFAFLISEIHRKDIMHLTYGSPLLLIILFGTCCYYLDNKRLHNIVTIIVTGVLILFGGFHSLVAASANQEIDTKRGRLYGFKEDSALNFLIEHTKPGDYAFIYPYYPMYYFLADVKNPTRYSILLYHINTEVQFTEVIDNLEQKKVKYVLFDTLVAGAKIKTWFPQYEHPPREKLHLERYLENNYSIVGIKNGFKILCRRID